MYLGPWCEMRTYTDSFSLFMTIIYLFISYIYLCAALFQQGLILFIMIYLVFLFVTHVDFMYI